jgi:uncharacterized protein YbaR (Trm112 family)
MDDQTLNLLCDPETHAPLEVSGDSLMNSESGRRYPIRDGIPVFLQEVTGPNRKYQAMYDRLAPGYDIAERLYRWVSRKADYRLEYIRELEIPAGACVLEVSVGTGANLRYLRADIEFLGLDLSWGMLRRCRHNAGSPRPNYSRAKPSGCLSATQSSTAFFTPAASTSSATRRALSRRWSASLSPERRS